MSFSVRGNPATLLFLMLFFTTFSLFYLIVFDRDKTSLKSEEEKTRYSSDYLKSRVINNFNTSYLVLNDLKKDIEIKNYFSQGDTKNLFIHGYFKGIFEELLVQFFKGGAIVLRNKDSGYEIDTFNDKNIIKGDILFKKRVEKNGKAFYIELFKSLIDNNIYLLIRMDIYDSNLNEVGDIAIISYFVPKDMDSSLMLQQSIIVASKYGELLQYFGSDKKYLHNDSLVSFKRLKDNIPSDEMFLNIDLESINNTALSGFLFFSDIGVISSSSNRGMSSKGYYLYILMFLFSFSVAIIAYLTSIGVKIKSNYFNRRVVKGISKMNTGHEQVIYKWYDADQIKLISSIEEILIKNKMLKAKIVSSTRFDKLSGLLNSYAFLNDSEQMRSKKDTEASVIVMKIRKESHYFFNCEEDVAFIDMKMKNLISVAIEVKVMMINNSKFNIYKTGNLEYSVIIIGINNGVILNEIADMIIEPVEMNLLDSNKEKYFINLGFSTNYNMGTSDIVNNAKKSLDISIKEKANKVMFKDNIVKHFNLLEAIKSDLKEAIEHDLLYLEYTPLYDLRKNQMMGVRIISRWTHPIEGDIPNSLLLELEDSLKLSYELSYWKIRTSFMQIQSWQRQGFRKIRYHIKINIEFILSDFFEGIMTSLISEFSLHDSLIFLSISENDAEKIIDKNPYVYETIKKTGLKIEIRMINNNMCLSINVNKTHAKAISVELPGIKNNSKSYDIDKLKIIEFYSNLKCMDFFIGGVDSIDKIDDIKKNTNAFASGDVLNGPKIANEIEELFTSRIKHI